jgi:hypothetical protein
MIAETMNRDSCSLRSLNPSEFVDLPPEIVMITSERFFDGLALLESIRTDYLTGRCSPPEAGFSKAEDVIAEATAPTSDEPGLDDLDLEAEGAGTTEPIQRTGTFTSFREGAQAAAGFVMPTWGWFALAGVGLVGAVVLIKRSR